MKALSKRRRRPESIRDREALPHSTDLAREVHSCEPEDSVAAALKKMRTCRVRRLPVVDEDGRLIGIISLNDVAREGEREREAKLTKRAVKDSEIAQTLGAICTHNGSRVATRAA